MVDASNQLDPDIKAGLVVHKKSRSTIDIPSAPGKDSKLTGVEDTGGICAGTTKLASRYFFRRHQNLAGADGGYR